MAVNPFMDGARGVPGARNAGLDGMRSGLRGVEDAAREVAEQSLPPSSAVDVVPPVSSAQSPADAAEALVQLQVYQRQVQASARVVETADAVVGFLLDIHA
jgi:hypothetical protein